MLILAFFQWWYGPGWANQVKAISRRLKGIADSFSVGILIRTLFAPWKQIVSSTRSDHSLQLKMRAGVDNMISRLVGFLVRIIVLFVASMTILLVLVVSILIALIWPIVPAMILMMIPLGLAL